MKGRFVGALLAVLTVASTFGTARADDRHAGYYYPEPASREIYRSEAPRLPGTNQQRRIGFVVNLSNNLLDKNYAPPFALFAKGARGEKMLIVALQDGVLDTLYRARAQLANLTSIARSMPIFRQLGPTKLNFFDLLKMLGFEQITISDGDAFAHQVQVR
ncbi:MAG: molybdopterin-guanine dinucleotide biosynthesis protein A [Geminicoccaceae bacterium]